MCSCLINLFLIFYDTVLQLSSVQSNVVVFEILEMICYRIGRVNKMYVQKNTDRQSMRIDLNAGQECPPYFDVIDLFISIDRSD